MKSQMYGSFSPKSDNAINSIVTGTQKKDKRHKNNFFFYSMKNIIEVRNTNEKCNNS